MYIYMDLDIYSSEFYLAMAHLQCIFSIIDWEGVEK